MVPSTYLYSLQSVRVQSTEISLETVIPVL